MRHWNNWIFVVVIIFAIIITVILLNGCNPSDVNNSKLDSLALEQARIKEVTERELVRLDKEIKEISLDKDTTIFIKEKGDTNMVNFLELFHRFIENIPGLTIVLDSVNYIDSINIIDKEVPVYVTKNVDTAKILFIWDISDKTECTVLKDQPLIFRWLPVSNAIGYKLYYGSHSGIYDGYKMCDSALCKFGVINTTLYFSYSAYNSGGESEKSPELKVIVK